MVGVGAVGFQVADIVGTGVLVVAEDIVWCEEAADVGVTGVGGAVYRVNAGQRRPANALANFTVVPIGACITIVAVACGRRMRTAQFRVTAIGGAVITITAVSEFATLAGAEVALVANGTGVAIFARCCIEIVNAAIFRVTDTDCRVICGADREIFLADMVTSLRY